MRAQAEATIGEAGVVLLVVLVILMVVTASSTSFIWFMNQQQARAGGRYRAAAAMAAAEAGVHRVLAILESDAPDGGPGRTWRPDAYAETLPPGPSAAGLDARYTVSMADEPDGAVVVTSTGEAGGVRRRLRARVYLASPALLAAIYGTSVVRMEPQAATFIVPYGAGLGDLPWMHIAAGRGLWFSTRRVAINEPSRTVDAAAGPVDGPGGAAAATAPPQPGPLRLLLARGADLILEQNLRRVEMQRLRTLGAYVDGEVARADGFPAPPEVDRAYFQVQAAMNVANTGLNQAAGDYLLDGALARKFDSLYSPREFEQVLAYLAAGRWRPRMEGIVYVTGEVALAEGRSLQIVDGSLVAEDSVQIGAGAELEITHSAATRALPGLIVLDAGRLAVGRGARLQVHGLVYASRVFDMIYGAHVEVVGSVVGADPAIAFNNLAATAIIRYDPAVLGTPGLRVPSNAPVVAWVAAWGELPP